MRKGSTWINNQTVCCWLERKHFHPSYLPSHPPLLLHPLVAGPRPHEDGTTKGNIKNKRSFGTINELREIGKRNKKKQFEIKPVSLKIVRKKRSWRKKIEKFSIAETQGRKNEWKDSKKEKFIRL